MGNWTGEAFPSSAYHSEWLRFHRDATEENAMNEFIAKYQDQLSGTLSGFDRIVLRGNLRALCGVPGMDQYLATEHVLYKDFGRHVLQVSRQIKQASVARAEREGRVIQYLSSS